MASDPLEASRINRAFHFRLAEAAEMPLLHATIEGMWAQMGPLVHLYHLNTPTRQHASSSAATTAYLKSIMAELTPLTGLLFDDIAVTLDSDTLPRQTY